LRAFVASRPPDVLTWEADVSISALLKAKGRFVPSISMNLAVSDVIDKLDFDEAGALVVVDEANEIRGIITERDIARGLKKFGRDVVDMPIRELMTSTVHTCPLSESVEAVLRLMDEQQIEQVPIVNNGRLYGIINMLDLVKYRLSQIDAEAAALKAYVAGVPPAGTA